MSFLFESSESTQNTKYCSLFHIIFCAYEDDEKARQKVKGRRGEGGWVKIRGVVEEEEEEAILLATGRNERDLSKALLAFFAFY